VTGRDGRADQTAAPISRRRPARAAAPGRGCRSLAGSPRSRWRSLPANRRRGTIGRWPVGSGPRWICSPPADVVAARTPAGSSL